MWSSGPSVGSGWPWAWWMLSHGIASLLFLALLIGAVIILVRFLRGGGGRRGSGNQRSPGLDVLEERYAQGEIDRGEYLQKKRDIISHGAAV